MPYWEYKQASYELSSQLRFTSSDFVSSAGFLYFDYFYFLFQISIGIFFLKLIVEKKYTVVHLER